MRKLFYGIGLVFFIAVANAQNISQVVNTVAVGGITGLGTGVATALGINVGSAGAVVTNGGALGTPASGVATNLTGTASGLTAGNVTTNANLSGDVTSVGNATTIAANAVTNAKAAQMANSTIKCRTTAATGDPEDCTAAQAEKIVQGGKATLSASPSNPTGTTSTTAKMAGIGSSCAITPATTKIVISVGGYGRNTSSGDSYFVNIAYGTGAAPSNGASATGTAPASAIRADMAAANQDIPFFQEVLVTGLTAGVALWIDLQFNASSTGTASLFGLYCKAYDL